jgi:hypothetical protein
MKMSNMEYGVEIVRRNTQFNQWTGILASVSEITHLLVHSMFQLWSWNLNFLVRMLTYILSKRPPFSITQMSDYFDSLIFAMETTGRLLRTYHKSFDQSFNRDTISHVNISLHIQTQCSWQAHRSKGQTNPTLNMIMANARNCSSCAWK